MNDKQDGCLPERLGMQDEPKQRLRRLLHERAAHMARRAVADPEAVDERQVAELERLQKLLEIYEQSITLTRWRWPIAVALVLTLSVVSGLLFIKIPATAIELDLKLRGVSFRFADLQRFTTGLTGLPYVGVSTLKRIDIPRSRTRPQSSSVSAPAGHDLSVRFEVQPDDQPPGELTVQTLAWPKDTHVAIQHHRDGYTIYGRFPKAHPSVPLSVNLRGAVSITIPGQLKERFVFFPVPRAVNLQPHGSEIGLDIGIQPNRGEPFAARLLAEALRFEADVEFGMGERRMSRRVSTVLGGRLYFVSLGDQYRDLRRGEWLEFQAVKGEILALHLGNDDITMRFQGRVRGMSTGTGQHQRSLMPSLLAWLRARHGLAMLWATTGSVLSLVLIVFRWWGKPLWQA